jgi:hypothetical protein
LLKGEVIHAIRLWRAGLIATFHTCSPNSSYPLTRIAVILPGNYLQYHVVYIHKKKFGFLSYPGAALLCKRPVRYLLVDPHGLDQQFVAPLMLTFRLAEHILGGMLSCWH